MRAVYIDNYHMKNKNNYVFVSVSLPILERKSIKTQLKAINDEIMSFDNINYQNIKKYYDYCSFFIKNIHMNSSIKKVFNYKRSMYCRTLLNLIENEYYSANKEELRVYIPFETNKNHLKTINKMLKKRHINAYVEEIRYSESKLSQLSNIIAGTIYYHDREDLYERNIGKKGKPQLVAYLYSCKKTKNKMTFLAK